MSTRAFSEKSPGPMRPLRGVSSGITNKDNTRGVRSRQQQSSAPGFFSEGEARSETRMKIKADATPSSAYVVPPAEVNAIAARAQARKEKKQQQQQYEIEAEESAPAPEPAQLLANSGELNAIAARAAARKAGKQQEQQPAVVSEEPQVVPEQPETYVDGARLNAMAARAAARKAGKQQEQQQQQRETELVEPPLDPVSSYADQGELHAIAARAAARKEKKQLNDQQQQQQQQEFDEPDSPPPEPAQLLANSGELNAMAARAAARKAAQQELQQPAPLQAEGGSKASPREEDASTFVQRAELNAIAARAAARKERKQQQQSMAGGEDAEEASVSGVGGGTALTEEFYVPPAELNAIAARAAARKQVQQQRELLEEPPLPGSVGCGGAGEHGAASTAAAAAAHEADTLAHPAELSAIAARAEARKAENKLKASSPSLDNPEDGEAAAPAFIDGGGGKPLGFLLPHDEEHLRMEVSLIAFRAQARREQKEREQQQQLQQEDGSGGGGGLFVVEGGSSSSSFRVEDLYIPPAELNAIATRARERRMLRSINEGFEGEQEQVGNGVGGVGGGGAGGSGSSSSSSNDPLVSADVMLIAQRAAERAYLRTLAASKEPSAVDMLKLLSREEEYEGREEDEGAFYFPPAELKAIAQRAVERKRKQQEGKEDSSEGGGGRGERGADDDTDSNVSGGKYSNYRVPEPTSSEVLLVAQRAAERAAQRKLRQLMAANGIPEEEDDSSLVSEDDEVDDEELGGDELEYYIPTAELNAIAQRTVERRKQQQREQQQLPLQLLQEGATTTLATTATATTDKFASFLSDDAAEEHLRMEVSLIAFRAQARREQKEREQQQLQQEAGSGSGGGGGGGGVLASGVDLLAADLEAITTRARDRKRAQQFKHEFKEGQAPAIVTTGGLQAGSPLTGLSAQKASSNQPLLLPHTSPLQNRKLPPSTSILRTDPVELNAIARRAEVRRLDQQQQQQQQQQKKNASIKAYLLSSSSSVALGSAGGEIQSRLAKSELDLIAFRAAERRDFQRRATANAAGCDGGYGGGGGVHRSSGGESTGGGQVTPPGGQVVVTGADLSEFEQWLENREWMLDTSKEVASASAAALGAAPHHDLSARSSTCSEVVRVAQRAALRRSESNDQRQQQQQQREQGDGEALQDNLYDFEFDEPPLTTTVTASFGGAASMDGLTPGGEALFAMLAAASASPCSNASNSRGSAAAAAMQVVVPPLTLGSVVNQNVGFESSQQASSRSQAQSHSSSDPPTPGTPVRAMINRAAERRRVWQQQQEEEEEDRPQQQKQHLRQQPVAYQYLQQQQQQQQQESFGVSRSRDSGGGGGGEDENAPEEVCNNDNYSAVSSSPIRPLSADSRPGTAVRAVQARAEDRANQRHTQRQQQQHPHRRQQHPHEKPQELGRRGDEGDALSGGAGTEMDEDGVGAEKINGGQRELRVANVDDSLDSFLGSVGGGGGGATAMSAENEIKMGGACSGRDSGGGDSGGGDSGGGDSGGGNGGGGGAVSELDSLDSLLFTGDLSRHLSKNLSERSSNSGSFTMRRSSMDTIGAATVMAATSPALAATALAVTKSFSETSTTTPSPATSPPPSTTPPSSTTTTTTNTTTTKRRTRKVEGALLHPSNLPTPNSARAAALAPILVSHDDVVVHGAPSSPTRRREKKRDDFSAEPPRFPQPLSSPPLPTSHRSAWTLQNDDASASGAVVGTGAVVVERSVVDNDEGGGGSGGGRSFWSDANPDSGHQPLGRRSDGGISVDDDGGESESEGKRPSSEGDVVADPRRRRRRRRPPAGGGNSAAPAGAAVGSACGGGGGGCCFSSADFGFFSEGSTSRPGSNSKGGGGGGGGGGVGRGARGRVAVVATSAAGNDCNEASPPAFFAPVQRTGSLVSESAATLVAEAAAGVPAGKESSGNGGGGGGLGGGVSGGGDDDDGGDAGAGSPLHHRLRSGVQPTVVLTPPPGMVLGNGGDDDESDEKGNDDGGGAVLQPRSPPPLSLSGQRKTPASSSPSVSRKKSRPPASSWSPPASPSSGTATLADADAAERVKEGRRGAPTQAEPKRALELRAGEALVTAKSEAVEENKANESKLTAATAQAAGEGGEGVGDSKPVRRDSADAGDGEGPTLIRRPKKQPSTRVERQAQRAAERRAAEEEEEASRLQLLLAQEEEGEVRRLLVEEEEEEHCRLKEESATTAEKERTQKEEGAEFQAAAAAVAAAAAAVAAAAAAAAAAADRTKAAAAAAEERVVGLAAAAFPEERAQRIEALAVEEEARLAAAVSARLEAERRREEAERQTAEAQREVERLRAEAKTLRAEALATATLATTQQQAAEDRGAPSPSLANEGAASSVPPANSDLENTEAAAAAADGEAFQTLQARADASTTSMALPLMAGSEAGSGGYEGEETKEEVRADEEKENNFISSSSSAKAKAAAAEEEGEKEGTREKRRPLASIPPAKPFRPASDPRAGPLELEGILRAVGEWGRGFDVSSFKDLARMQGVNKAWLQAVDGPARTYLSHPATVNAMCRFTHSGFGGGGGGSSHNGGGGESDQESVGSGRSLNVGGRDGGEGRLLVTACADNVVRLWDVLAEEVGTGRLSERGATEEEEAAAAEEEGAGMLSFNSAACSGGRGWGVAGSSSSSGSSIRVGGALGLQQRRRRPLGRVLCELGGHTKSVDCVAALHQSDQADRGGAPGSSSSYGGNLVSGGLDGYLRLWDVEVAQAVRGFEAHVGDPAAAAAAGGGAAAQGNNAAAQAAAAAAAAVTGVKSVASIGDGLVVTGGRNGAVCLWDPRAREPRVAQLPGHARGKAVSCVCALPSKQTGFSFVTGGFDGKLRFWDLRRVDDARMVHSVNGDRNRVTSVSALGGRHLVTGGREGSVKVWDMKHQACAPSLNNPAGIEEHPAQWTCSRTLTNVHAGGVTALDDASYYGNLVEKAAAWWKSSSSSSLGFEEADDRKENGRSQHGEEEDNAAPAPVFLPPLPPIITGGARTGTVKLFDLNKPEPPSTPKFSFHPTLDTLASKQQQDYGLAGTFTFDGIARHPAMHQRTGGGGVAGSGGSGGGGNGSGGGGSIIWEPPSWLATNDTQLSSASVNSIVALSLHLRLPTREGSSNGVGPKIVPQRIAAAVRNDVCIWHIRRPDYED